MNEGFVVDMIIESGNDNCEYAIKASQEDFNNF